jgi:hypothetical protein
VIFQIGDVRCIWLDRDDEGYLQLNFRMPTNTGRPGAEIEQNFWKVVPAVDEVISPPNGRLVEVSYHNGDKFRAEFFDIESPDALDSRYPQADTRRWSGRLEFPITAIELWETAAGTSIEFGPNFSRVGGAHITNFFAFYAQENAKAAILLTPSKEELMMLFPQEDKTYVESDINLTDLLNRSEQPPRLEGLTFIRCRIHGPIVAYPFGAPNDFSGSRPQDPIESMLFEVPEGSSKVGAVPLIACRFIDCEIEGMGIIGTPEQLAPFRQMS